MCLFVVDKSWEAKNNDLWHMDLSSKTFFGGYFLTRVSKLGPGVAIFLGENERILNSFYVLRLSVVVKIN